MIKKLISIAIVSVLIFMSSCTTPGVLTVSKYVDPITNDTSWRTSEQRLTNSLKTFVNLYSQAYRFGDYIIVKFEMIALSNAGYINKGDFINVKLTDGTVIKGNVLDDSKTDVAFVNNVTSYKKAIRVSFLPEDMDKITEVPISYIQLIFSDAKVDIEIDPQFQSVIKNQLVILGVKSF